MEFLCGKAHLNAMLLITKLLCLPKRLVMPSEIPSEIPSEKD